MPVFQVPTNAKVISQVNLFTLFLSLLLDLFQLVNPFHSNAFFEQQHVKSSQNWAGLLAMKFYLSKNYLLLAGLKYTD